MACLNLGDPKDVTVEYDDDFSCFFISIKEICVYEFTLDDCANKELNFSFSIPPSDREGLVRTQYISIENNRILNFLTLPEYCPAADKKRILAAFQFMGCKIVK